MRDLLTLRRHRFDALFELLTGISQRSMDLVRQSAVPKGVNDIEKKG